MAYKWSPLGDGIYWVTTPPNVTVNDVLPRLIETEEDAYGTVTCNHQTIKFQHGCVLGDPFPKELLAAPVWRIFGTKDGSKCAFTISLEYPANIRFECGGDPDLTVLTPLQLSRIEAYYKQHTPNAARPKQELTILRRTVLQ